MVTLGRAIAGTDPQAAVISVASPDPSDLGPAGQGSGFQWFSVRGITEDNRPARVAKAMPRFIACVRDWQEKTGVGPDATVLIGFSQGGIMALEATQQPEILAQRVFGLSTRFAEAPTATPWADIHLIHGDADPVIASAHAGEAQAQLLSLDARITLDIVSGMGHTIDHSVTQKVLQYLAHA